MELKYCTRCLYPETKPELWFDNRGVCSACQAYEARQEVDWRSRENDFVRLVNETWDRRGRPCVIVPVSGGKDSTAQVARCLSLGFRVLAVNARTDFLTPLGRRNLDNIASMCDLVEFHPDDVLRRDIMRLALEEVGDWSWPEHVLIHTVPFQAAVFFDIPIIVFGELAQNEYGAGPRDTQGLELMTRRWVEEFAGLLGLRVTDVQQMLDIAPEEMSMYRFPDAEILQDTGVKAIWMGQFFPWDGYENFLTAQRYGFEEYPNHVEGSLYGYENLDNFATGGRDYIRYLKYGYGRATDIACNHIRRGRLTRHDAIKEIKDRDGSFPWTYLGDPIENVLDKMGLTVEKFLDICDRFTNKKLFRLPLNDRKPEPLFVMK